MTRVHSSSSWSRSRPERPRPAQVTSTSRPPNSRSDRSARTRPSAERLTSPRTATARPPERRISAAVASAVSARSATTTPAPSAAKARAIARPMPPPAPVTTTARPSRRIAGSGEADGDPAEPSERGTHGVAGLRAEQGRDRARHDELARPEREPAPAQVIGDPRERVQRIAHHFRGRVRRDDRPVELVDEPLDREIQVGHVRERRAHDNRVGEDSVGDNVGRDGLAAHAEVDELERRHGALDRQEGPRGRDARSGEVVLEHERHLRLDDEAREACARDLGAVREDPRGEEEAAHRLLAPVRRLGGLVGEARLPADHPVAAGHEGLAQAVLHRVGLGQRQAPLLARRRDRAVLLARGEQLLDQGIAHASAIRASPPDMTGPSLPRITKSARASRGVGARLTMTSEAPPCLAWTGMEAAGKTTGRLATWNNSARRVASPITCGLRTVDAHQAYHVRQRRSQTTEPTKTHPLVTSSAAFGPAPPTVPTSAASMVKRAVLITWHAIAGKALPATSVIQPRESPRTKASSAWIHSRRRSP